MSAPTPPPPQPGGWQAPPPPPPPAVGGQVPQPAPYPPAQQPANPPGGSPLPPSTSTGSGMAVASVVLSLAGFVLGLLASGAGIVLGFIARRKAAAAGRPTGTATAGIVIGFVSTFTSLILGVLVALAFIGAAQSVAVEAQMGERAVAAVTDANQWYATMGSYYGWELPADLTGPGTLSVSGDSTSGEVCVAVADDTTAVHAYGITGELVAPDPSTDEPAWQTGPCPSQP